MPVVSIVTPTYNALRFIDEAYASLLRQEVRDWEWVVVDDGSTDGTYEHLLSLAATDARVLVDRIGHSGVAKVPRDHAVSISHSTLVLMLDADDWLQDGYLDKMLTRMQVTDADIVYANMRAVEAGGTVRWALPKAGFDLSQVVDGQQAVRLTIPDWQIGGNGLYRRHILMLEPLGAAFMNSDEVDERRYQLRARRIAFADAVYFYRMHAESITKSFSVKTFHPLVTDLQLLDVMAGAFGSDSHEYRLMHDRACQRWRNMLALFYQHYRQMPDDRKRVQGYLQTSARTLGIRWYRVQCLLHCLRYAPTLLPGFLAGRMSR